MLSTAAPSPGDGRFSGLFGFGEAGGGLPDVRLVRKREILATDAQPLKM